MKLFKRIIALMLTIAVSVICLASCNKDPFAKKEYVEMNIVNYGKIVIELYPDVAPITVKNFKKLVSEGFYNGLTFHRIVKDFMIQGGDPDGNGSGNSSEKITGEFESNGFKNPLSHERGVISMARSNNPDSASCQFFICNADARESLDGNYAAFGRVVEGMDVVDKITEEVFPKTAYADYYEDMSYDSYYQTYKHYVWQSLGNGMVENDSDKPVIEYIKVLENYTHD